MYECPNCNANLKFDISSQMLLCDRCGTTMDPYAFQKEQDAEESSIWEDNYEATVFTCPQCGGRILSDDTTAATFCSYCGSSTILQSRVDYLRRPSYIIPFQKTREDCNTIYQKMMRHAWYAPKELKSESHMARMRSIYMPYWVYTARKDGRVRLSATQNTKGINDNVTIYVWLQSFLHAEYKWLSFDASRAFSDPLSNAIAPFIWLDAKRFTPSFLSGFYADVEDVNSDLYESDVADIVADELLKHLEKDPYYQKYTMGDVTESLRPNDIHHELALFPVWFLTYRNRDRVSYVVINGQTGKAAGDIPVDIGRYMKGSFLFAIPLFLLLSLIGTIPAFYMLLTATLLSCGCAFLILKQQRQLRGKEDYMDDKGSGNYLDIGVKHRKNPGKYAIQEGHLTVGDALKASWRSGISILTAILILLLHPAFDLVYTFASIGIAFMTGWDILEMLRKHNILASRPLPQFNKRGGEADGR